MNSCYRCVHLYKETESWEMPHISWWECSVKAGVQNLTTFPFRNTKCKAFEEKPVLKTTSILSPGVYEPPLRMDTKHREVNFRPPVKWEE